MPVRIVSDPWLWSILFAYKTTLLTYPVVYIYRNYLQSPSPPVLLCRILIHGVSFHIPCNQYCKMGTSFPSGFQDIGELNIGEPPLSSTLGLVRNLQTGDISHQFHLFFEIFCFCACRIGSITSGLVRVDRLLVFEECV